MPTISGLDIKREITQIRLKPSEREALLSGFVRSCLALTISKSRELTLTLDCQTELVREYISSLMLDRFKILPRSDGELVYADCEKLLRMLGVFERDGDGFIPMGVPEEYKDNFSAYVRGVFLGCGSFSARSVDGDAQTQKSGGYHLEFSFLSAGFAEEFADLIREYSVVLHCMERGEKTVVYAKDSESVCNCLALMRLDKMVLTLNDTVITMSYKKTVNRRINCELANMTRTANAAVDVSDAIEYIDGAVGIETLKPKLLEAAEARQNSPDKSLGELAFELGISKSGLKHRYDSIIAIADKLKSERQSNG